MITINKHSGRRGPIAYFLPVLLFNIIDMLNDLWRTLKVLKRNFHILWERAIKILRSKWPTGRALSTDGCHFEDQH